jgi:hypothetical protein
VTINVNLNVNTVNPSTGSILGGNISLVGSGLPETWPNQAFTLTIATTSGVLLDPKVLSAKASELVLEIPAGVDKYAYTITI